MAIIIECSYAKKLGLPAYSSHNYSITVRTEVADLSQLEETNSHLYGLLQHAVDSQIQQTGFVPEAGQSSNGHGPNGNGNSQPEWNCSPKQKELILNLVEEHDLDRKSVDKLSQEMFGTGVRRLNRLEASGLIDTLMRANGNGSSRKRYGANRRNPARRSSS